MLSWGGSRLRYMGHRATVEIRVAMRVYHGCATHWDSIHLAENVTVQIEKRKGQQDELPQENLMFVL